MKFLPPIHPWYGVGKLAMRSDKIRRIEVSRPIPTSRVALWQEYPMQEIGHRMHDITKVTIGDL